MKELFRVRVQYASRHQCCKTHKQPLPCLPFMKIKICEIGASSWFHYKEICYAAGSHGRKNSNSIFPRRTTSFCLYDNVLGEYFLQNFR